MKYYLQAHFSEFDILQKNNKLFKKKKEYYNAR